MKCFDYDMMGTLSVILLNIKDNAHIISIDFCLLSHSSCSSCDADYDSTQEQ